MRIGGWYLIILCCVGFKAVGLDPFLSAALWFLTMGLTIIFFMPRNYEAGKNYKWTEFRWRSSNALIENFFGTPLQMRRRLTELERKYSASDGLGES